MRYTELENLAKFLRAARPFPNAVHADGASLYEYPQRMTKRRVRLRSCVGHKATLSAHDRRRTKSCEALSTHVSARKIKVATCNSAI